MCSKEEKLRVSVELMESVTIEGHCFWGKNLDGKWYKVNNVLRVVIKDVASTSNE